MKCLCLSILVLLVCLDGCTSVMEKEGCVAEQPVVVNNQTATPSESIAQLLDEDSNATPAKWDESLQDIVNEQVRILWKKTHEYMTNSVLVDAEYDSVRKQCKNKHRSCTLYAAHGECQKNPHWMRLNCGPACQVCHELDLSKRCPIDRNAQTLFGPGHLNEMYERIVRDFAQYDPKIHSKPGGDPNDSSVIDGPWVITLESFLSKEEATDLIKAAEKQGLKPSIGKAVKRPDGTYDRVLSNFRTSSSAYCHDNCYSDAVTRSFNDKIENVTATPHSHSTHLHFLRYEESQFYGLHSDYVPQHLTDQQHGVRIMTVLTYLSDVEAGGGTHFPALKLTVQPKRGRVVIFPNVLDDKPNSEEKSTKHEALPVVRGVKYAVSMYVHQKDYKTPFAEHCIR